MVRGGEFLSAPGVGRVVVGDGDGNDTVAGAGDERPDEQDKPADDRPAEEEIEQEDERDAVAAIRSDDGGQEVEKGEKGDEKHRLPRLGQDWC